MFARRWCGAGAGPTPTTPAWQALHSAATCPPPPPTAPAVGGELWQLNGTLLATGLLPTVAFEYGCGRIPSSCARFPRSCADTHSSSASRPLVGVRVWVRTLSGREEWAGGGCASARAHFCRRWVRGASVAKLAAAPCARSSEGTGGFEVARPSYGAPTAVGWSTRLSLARRRGTCGGGCF